MGASSSRSSVPRWNTLHERGRGKEEADARGKETEENEDVEKGLCGCKKKKKTNAKYGSNHTNTIQSKEKTKKKKEENYDAIIGDENDEDRRRRSRYDGRSSQSVSSEDEDEVAKRLQYESLSAKTKKGTHGSKESSVKSSEKSSKKQLRKEKEQLAMNAKLYDLEKQEILATRKKISRRRRVGKRQKDVVVFWKSVGFQSCGLRVTRISGSFSDYFRHRVALLRERLGVFQRRRVHSSDGVRRREE